jgi:hypothetical protein
VVSRPAESLSATLGALIVAVVAVLTSLGVEVPVGVVTAATAVVGFVAAAVTWWVARKQRDITDPLGSAKDGTVID